MSISKESLVQHAATAASLSAVLRAIVSRRGVQAAVALCAAVGYHGRREGLPACLIGGLWGDPRPVSGD